MGTSRRQFFQVTAGGLVAASGLAAVPRPVRAQGPTVRIGTAVLGDYSLISPIVVALEKAPTEISVVPLGPVIRRVTPAAPAETPDP